MEKMRSLVVHPKDKLDRDEVCGAIYEVGCLNCDSVYIGETGRPFSVRLAEHKKDVNQHTSGVRTRASRESTSSVLHKSAITDHMSQYNHTPNWENTKIIQKEQSWQQREIREAIWIREKSKTMNRDDGSYQLSHIYDHLLKPGGPGGPGEHSAGNIAGARRRTPPDDRESN